MTHLAMVGCGHVGLVSAVCFAELGHTVDCIDIDAARIAELREGRTPIHEPELERLLRRGLAADRLRFHDSYPEPLQAEIVVRRGRHAGGAGRRGRSARRARRDEPAGAAAAAGRDHRQQEHGAESARASSWRG